jgi:GH141 insertion domain/Carbohydrate binding module (family 6)/Right handed beta helix region
MQSALGIHFTAFAAFAALLGCSADTSSRPDSARQAESYSGSPARVPGVIEAKTFDVGGEGVAYHDSSPGNEGGRFRPNEDVDIWGPFDGNDIIGSTVAGEWLTYTIDVAASGSYTFRERVSTVDSGGSFHLEVDGVNVTGAIVMPPGGWPLEWRTLSQSGIALGAGTHVLRVSFDTNGTGGIEVANLNTITIQSETSGGDATTFYVSPSGSDGNPGTEGAPFQTIARAQDAVRAQNAAMGGDLTVYLRGGRYELSAPVTFDARDSGNNGFRVIYRAYPGEKPVLSGGTGIGGWTAAGGGIYRADVGGLRFRQLYVNGSAGTRARTPNAGTYYKLRTYDLPNRSVLVNAGEIESWSRMNEVEMVIQRSWAQSNLRIDSFSVADDTASVVPMDPERTVVFGDTPQNPGPYGGGYDQAYHFENALELLDQPGEWYLATDSNQVYYMPRPGEDMASAEAIAPRLQTVLLVRGAPDDQVHDLQFYGLAFEHATWLAPSSIGLVAGQSASEFGYPYYPGRENLPFGVHVESARSVRFERCTFRHMGASGLGFYAGVQDSAVVGSVFEDIAGNGISDDMYKLYNNGVVDDPSVFVRDAWTLNKRNAIQNNYVTRIGLIGGGIGIHTGFTEASLIEHNEVTEVPYTGISIGWGQTDLDTALRDNVIRFNRVHRAMTLYGDGGGIYIPSRQPGTRIEQNYLYDINPSPWMTPVYTVTSGIYMELGSSFITVQNNVVDGVQTGLSGVGHDCAFLDMTITNTGTPVQDQLREPDRNNRFANTGGATPDAVRAQAGIEPAYQDIVSGR